MTSYLPDTNVWLALALDWHPLHDRARSWWDGLSDGDRVLLCRPVQMSTLRLLTTRAVFAAGGVEPLTNIEAWAVVDAIVGDPRVELSAIEPEGAAALWRGMSAVAAASPRIWMDAYLSALALAGATTLVTGDHALAASHAGDVVAL